MNPESNSGFIKKYVFYFIHFFPKLSIINWIPNTYSTVK